MTNPTANPAQAVSQIAQGAAAGGSSLGLITKAIEAMFSDSSTREKLTGIVGALVGAGVTGGATDITNALAGNISPTQVAAVPPAQGKSTGMTA